ASAVATKTPGRTTDSSAKRLFPLRAPPSTRSDDRIARTLPRRPVETRASGQVSWLSDRPTPRAFPAGRRPVALGAFVPDYSDGVAAGLDRLPWGPLSRAPGREQRTHTSKGAPARQGGCPGSLGPAALGGSEAAGAHAGVEGVLEGRIDRARLARRLLRTAAGSDPARGLRRLDRPRDDGARERRRRGGDRACPGCDVREARGGRVGGRGLRVRRDVPPRQGDLSAGRDAQRPPPLSHRPPRDAGHGEAS